MSPMKPAALLMALSLLLLAAAAPGNGDVKKVTIKDKKFDPAKITLKAGQSVQWTNKDNSDHQVVITLDGKAEKESENLGNGETFKHTFDKPGKYRFVCKYHPREKGEITVTE